MNEDAIISTIVQSFEGVETATANGDTFFFYGDERMFPFATLVMSDFNDSYSNLSRPAIFRLNMGVSKPTYQALFGAQTPRPGGPEGAAEPVYDFTVLDALLPHPVYGRQYWVCILSPSEATFAAQVRPLLAEAHALAVAKRSSGGKPA